MGLSVPPNRSSDFSGISIMHLRAFADASVSEHPRSSFTGCLNKLFSFGRSRDRAANSEELHVGSGGWRGRTHIRKVVEKTHRYEISGDLDLMLMQA